MLDKRREAQVRNFRMLLSRSEKDFILTKVASVLDSDQWTNGALTEAFEQAFEAFCGQPSVALSSGGAALTAALWALDVPRNSIVLCPTLTAPPTPHAILLAGMRVMLVDCSPGDIGIDPARVREIIQRRGSEIGAVICVHLGGWISRGTAELAEICQRAHIPLIEDCAHAHGAALDGRPVGSFGRLAAYSFFMTKPLTAGEGGMVSSDDAHVIERLRIIRNYGKAPNGAHVMQGFNFRSSEFGAAVGLWAATHAHALLEERRRLAATYDELVADVAGVSVLAVPGCRSSYYKYVLETDAARRAQVKDVLRHVHGVELAGGVYDALCHEEQWFRTCPERVLNVGDAFPVAEAFARRQFCLPLYPGMTLDQQVRVVDALKDAGRG